MPQNTEIKSDIRFDDEIANKLLKELGIEVDKPTANKLSGELADHIVRMYQQALLQNGSVVTGTGIQSINSEHLGKGIYGIMIASYLDQVDEGRNSGNHPPVDGNERLTKWADKHGMNPYALAEHIYQHGTRPHPFKEKALDRSRSAARSMGEKELEDVLEKVTKGMG